MEIVSFFEDKRAGAAKRKFNSDKEARIPPASRARIRLIADRSGNTSSIPQSRMPTIFDGNASRDVPRMRRAIDRPTAITAMTECGRFGMIF